MQVFVKEGRFSTAHLAQDEVVTPGNAFGTLGANPAGLSLITGPEVDASFEGASADGHFTLPTGEGGTLSPTTR